MRLHCDLMIDAMKNYDNLVSAPYFILSPYFVIPSPYFE